MTLLVNSILTVYSKFVALNCTKHSKYSDQLGVEVGRLISKYCSLLNLAKNTKHKTCVT